MAVPPALATQFFARTRCWPGLGCLSSAADQVCGRTESGPTVERRTGCHSGAMVAAVDRRRAWRVEAVCGRSCRVRVQYVRCHSADADAAGFECLTAVGIGGGDPDRERKTPLCLSRPVGLAPTTTYFSARMLIEPTRTTPVQLTQGKESVRERTVGFVQTRPRDRHGRVHLRTAREVVTQCTGMRAAGRTLSRIRGALVLCRQHALSARWTPEHTTPQRLSSRGKALEPIAEPLVGRPISELDRYNRPITG